MTASRSRHSAGLLIARLVSSAAVDGVDGSPWDVSGEPEALTVVLHFGYREQPQNPLLFFEPCRAVRRRMGAPHSGHRGMVGDPSVGGSAPCAFGSSPSSADAGSRRAVRRASQAVGEKDFVMLSASQIGLRCVRSIWHPVRCSLGGRVFRFEMERLCCARVRVQGQSDSRRASRPVVCPGLWRIRALGSSGR